MDNNLSQFVPNVRFEQIPIKYLVSNQDYQRPINNTHVGRTALNFNLYQINPVKVSFRNGNYYVFDGQHTIETVATASQSRETPVWCMIYDDLDYESEADIFANQKKFTRPLKSIEVFNANIEAENDIQTTIKRVVESYGLIISQKKIAGHIGAVSALEYIFDKYGYQVLDRTILLLVSTWQGEVDSLSCNMVKGVAKLIMAYGDKLNDEQFVERLSKVPIREVIRQAKDRHAGTQGYAEALLLQYNKRLKFPLKWENLKTAKPTTVESIPASEMDIESDAVVVNPETGELIDEDIPDDIFDDEEDDEGIPDCEGALPDQMLMDGMRIRTRFSEV